MKLNRLQFHEDFETKFVETFKISDKCPSYLGNPGSAIGMGRVTFLGLSENVSK